MEEDIDLTKLLIRHPLATFLINNTVALAAKGSMMLGRKKLSANQFANQIEKLDGFILTKPATWEYKLTHSPPTAAV